MSTWVLIRGLAREAGHWGDFPQRLEAAMAPCKVLTPDLPGNGLRHAEPSPIHVSAMVDALLEMLADGGDPPPYHVIGLSLGAMVAVAWAERRPEDLARLVLINTSMRPFSPFHARLRPGAWPAFIGAAVPGRSARARESAILEITSNMPRSRAQALPHWTDIATRHPVSGINLIRQLLAAARFRAPAQPPDVPTLVLASTTDHLASVTCSRTLAAHWHCPLMEHPHAGHDIALDDGDWVIDQMARWMGAVPPRESPQAK